MRPIGRKYKQSGVGREWRDGLAEYTETKHITWLA